jgi:hypothetical protein
MAPHDGSRLMVGVYWVVGEILHIVKLNVEMATEIKLLARVARGGVLMVGDRPLPTPALPELVAGIAAHPGKVDFLLLCLQPEGPDARPGPGWQLDHAVEALALSAPRELSTGRRGTLMTMPRPGGGLMMLEIG